MVPVAFKAQLLTQWQGREQTRERTREQRSKNRVEVAFNVKNSESEHYTFFMALERAEIDFHDEYTWIFGRAAMKVLKPSFIKLDRSTFKVQIGPPDKEKKHPSVHGTATTSGDSQQLRSTEPHQSADRQRSCWRYCCVGETPRTRRYYFFYGSSSDSDCSCWCDTGSDCCFGCDQLTELCSDFFDRV